MSKLSSTGVNQPAGSGGIARRPLAAVVAAAAILAGASMSLVWLHASSHDGTSAPPAFLLDALGPSRPQAPTVRAPAPKVKVRIDSSGYTVARAPFSVSLSSKDARGAWQRFAAGAARSRAFGYETVTVGAGKTEQFLTVERRQGDKTWRWKLRTTGLRPRLGSGGSVDFWAGGTLAGLRLLPPRILDAAGRSVTPNDLAWKLERERSGWALKLHIDDTELPLPYVIDPAITYRSTASGANASNPTSPTTLALNKPASVVENDFLLARLTVNGGTNTTITPPSGWTLVRRDNNTTDVGQAVYWKVAGASEPASYTWNISSSSTPRAAGGILGYYGVDGTNPIDVSSSATGNSTAVAAPSVTTSATNARVVGFFGIDDNTTSTAPGGMAERYDVRNANANGPSAEAADVAQAGAGASGTKTATIAVAAQWIAQLIALRVDSVAPAAPAQTITESSPDSYATGSTFFYRPGGAGGSFTVTATTSDAQSGVLRVNFPGLAGGFTPTTALDDFSAPYSRTYSWTTGATESGSKTATAFDNAANSSTGTFTITQDSSLPATSDNTASIGSAWQTTDQTVTLTPAGTGSGVAATYYTTDGSTPTTSSTQGTSISLTADGVYTIKYFSVDNVGNVEPVQTASTQIRIDKNLPTSSLSVVEGSRPDLQYFDSSSDTYYYNPAAAGDFTFQDAAADGTGSGVASVAFPAITEVGFLGTGATDSSPSPYSSNPYSFDVVNLAAPADQTVVVTDISGKVTNDTVSFARDMTAPSGQTASLAGGPNFNILSVPFTTGDGSDAGAGLDPASGLVERASAPLTDGACGTFGAFGGSYTSPDTSVVSGNCYRYRFTIRDHVGNVSSPVVTADAKVDTGVPVVTLTDPGANLRATVALTATASDPVSGIASVAFQRSPAGADTWTAVGTDLSAPYSVDLDTGTLADGLYDFRAVATNGSGNSASSDVGGRRIDNTPPSATMNNPGSGLQGTETVTGTAGDAGSGVGNVTFQYSPATTDTWTTIAADSSAPYSAAWNTLAVNDGRYDLRVIALDAAGNSTTSAEVKNRQVTNHPPNVFITAPVEYVNAAAPDPSTITATTSVSVGKTVAQVEFFNCSDASANCTDGSWISLAVDTVAPYSASWNVGDDGNRALKAQITDSSDSTGTDVLNVIVDRTDPSGGSIDYSAGYSAGSVAIATTNGSDSGSGLDIGSAVIQRDSATLANNSCGSFADSWSAVTTPDTTLVSGTCNRYRYRIADNAGNLTTYTSPNVVKVDTSGPSAPSLSFGTFANASASGSTVYYRPGAAGGFTVTGTAGDGQSGIVSLSFPNLGAGWTGDGIDSSGPFEAAYTFGSSAGTPGSKNVTATNGAGLSTASSFTVDEDPSPPSGGSVTYADGYNSTGSVAITTDDGTDALSGVDSASGVIERESAPLSGGTCGAFSGSWITVTAPDTTIAASKCYRYRYRISDKVGNVATYNSSNAVKAVGTPPTGPTLTLSESPADPDQHVAGTTLYYNPGAGSSGTFEVDADTSDPDSGIQKVVFPALPGMTGGGDDLVGPYRSVYDWTAASTASGSYTVTARNNADLTSDGAFAATADGTPPSGHSVAHPGAPYYGVLSVPLTLDNGSDGGAGVDASSGVVERQGAIFSNGSCSGWSGSWAPVTLDAGADTSVLSGRCYVYRYTIADHVGNRSAASAETGAAKVDADAPSTTDNAPAVWRATAVTVTLSPADAESGVASTEYRVDGGPYQNGVTVVIPAPADGSNDGVHTITYRSNDLAGNVEAIRSATVRIDVSPPVPVLDHPGDTISSVVTLNSTSTADTTEIVFERSPVGEELWTPIERDETAPFSISFDTTLLADGLYDLRARAADAAANSGASVRRTVRISNAAAGGGGSSGEGGSTGGGSTGGSTGGDPPPPANRDPNAGGGTSTGGGSSSGGTVRPKALLLRVLVVKKTVKRQRLMLARVALSRNARVKLTLTGPRAKKPVSTVQRSCRKGITRITIKLARRVKPGRYTLLAVATAADRGKATRRLSVRVPRR